MPKVPIAFSTIPNQLIELILDKPGPKENLQLLKTNHYLRHKVLSNGLFGKRADKADFDFIENSNSFIATVTKNESSHEFDLLQQKSFSISLLGNVTSIRHLNFNDGFRDLQLEEDEIRAALKEPALKVLLKKVKLVECLHLEHITETWLDLICDVFNCKVTESAHFGTETEDSAELGAAHGLINFIESGLSFCKAISLHDLTPYDLTFSLDEELWQALLKTRVEFIEINAPYGMPKCCPEWIIKNVLPSENENCQILISLRFYPNDEDDDEHDTFAANPLWKSAEDVKLCREMELELRGRLFYKVEDFISVQCFKKSGCVDDLRFLMAKEPRPTYDEDDDEHDDMTFVMHFFVRRLKTKRCLF